jgi:oxygen-dependent protoporphyrinogen oxidase
MRVAIIGGGLAGLACAHRLKRYGAECVVFEAGDRPGGRSRTERTDGFVLDVGAHYLLGPEVFRNTFELIRETGLADNVLSIAPIAGQFYKGKVYRHRVATATGLLYFKGLHLIDKALLPKMAFLISRYGSTLDFQHPELGIAHDDESVAAFVRRELSQNILNYVAGPLISTLFFYPSHETSKLLYLLLAKHMQDTRMYTLREGIGTLAQRLAGIVGVRVNNRADGIGRSETGFVVQGQEFSDLVVAVQGDAVLKLPGMAEVIAAEDVSFFAKCAYQRVVTAFVATDRPVDGRCYAVSIPAVEGRSAATISFHDFIDPSRVPEGAGLLAVTGGGDDVSADKLLEDVQGIYPVQPRFVQTYEWASATPRFPPGRFKEIEAFGRRERIPGLFFCGDYLNGPFVESAIATGIKAAEGIVYRYGGNK